MKESHISHDPETILRLKDAILADFGKLPAEHQATLGLVLVNEVRNGEWGTWFTEALGLAIARTEHERAESEPDSFPTNAAAKEDLLYIRPDLAAQISALDATDIAKIADKVGDALSEDYWTTLEIVLASYVGAPAPDDNDEDLPPETGISHAVWDNWETDAQRELDNLPPLTTGQNSTSKAPPDNAELPKLNDQPDAPSNLNPGG